MKNLNFFLAFILVWLFKLYSQNILLDVPSEIDLGVNGIMLSDTSNVKTILGLSEISFEELLNTHFPPHLNFVNKDSSELLVLLFHPGSYKYEFNEFKVLGLTDKFSEKYSVFPNVKRFKTYKGLSLRMSIDEFKNIFGNSFEKETSNGEMILKFTLSGEYPDYGDSQFLKFYNMPIYYGCYTFIKNKLIKIEFGFSYP